MSRTPAALLMGLHYSSVQIASSLRQKGIRIFGIDMQSNPIGSHSRYIKKIEVPKTGKELKDFLIAFSRRIRKRVVLFPLGDYYLLFLLEHKESLFDHYFFPVSDQETVDRLTSKTRLVGLLSELGISHPKSVILKRGSPSLPPVKDLSFPCIIKPNFKHNWDNQSAVKQLAGCGQRVLLVTNQFDLQEAAKILSPLDDMVLQEFILGPSENHYYYVGYRDHKGKIVTSYLGNKIRTLPDCLGSETLLRSIHNSELLKYGDKILDRLDYKGPAGIDFKYDPRDNDFKVIEINCRIGINDCYLTKFGIDLPFIYYLDSQKIEVAPQRDYPANVTWYDPFRDLDWMREYHKKKNVGWASWLKQLYGHSTYALFDWSDPGPFVKSILEMFIRIIRKTNSAKAVAQVLHPFRGGKEDSA
jgi:D-aspartate ligase